MIESLIDRERLRRIGLTPRIAERLTAMPPLAGEPYPMRVIEVQREHLELHDGEARRAARVLPALLRALQAGDDALAVGDWVLAEAFANGEWWVHSRMPPLTQLSRRNHDGREKIMRQVIVSNIDIAMLVMGLDMDFSLRRLERYLALARLAGVGAVVVLTKADLCCDVPRRLQQVRGLLAPDDGLAAVNALDDGSRDALRPWLRDGYTLVLLGSSGAGKSTLINTLGGEAIQRTGEARQGDGRGRHTTTSRSLRVLREGACIIDTPGLRTLRLDADAASLDAVFGDIAQLQPQCRFRNCRHAEEPGCAVRGQVAAERLRNYHKLLRETRRDALSLRQRQDQRALWKSRARDARRRAGEKRESS